VITCFYALFMRSKTRDSSLHTEHLGFLALSKGLTNQCAFQTDATSLLLSESPNKSTKLTIWQEARIEIIPMIYLYCVFTPLTYGCNSLPTSHSWWSMHSLSRQKVSGNKTIHWKIFAQTGFLLEKVQLKLMMPHYHL